MKYINNNDLEKIIKNYLSQFSTKVISIYEDRKSGCDISIFLTGFTKDDYTPLYEISENLLSKINESMIIMHHTFPKNRVDMMFRTTRFIEIPVKNNNAKTTATTPIYNIRSAIIFCNFFKKELELESLKKLSDLSYNKLFKIISSENLENIHIEGNRFNNTFYLLNPEFICSEYCVNFIKLNVLNTV